MKFDNKDCVVYLNASLKRTLVVVKGDFFRFGITGFSVVRNERDTHWTPGTSDEVLDVYVWLFKDAVCPDFIFMDYNAKTHRANSVGYFLKERIFAI